ncbi:hypothetical protein PG989_015918 [Apiospora arundinis]|uniref:Uncharacterized protein n=1 Tax=Apiospora arundinis TaxID=335852 RepID=A0ABR2JHU3_9PEZI
MAPSRAAATTKKPFEYCEDSKPAWDPVTYLADAERHERAAAFLAKDDFASAIAVSFNLPPRDAYVYHAIVSVTLAQVQHVIGMGAANGLHTWYRDLSPPPATSDAATDSATTETQQQQQQQQQPKIKALGKPAAPPPRPDIDTYLSIFSPTTATPNILKTFALNAKKGSLRASIAAHLLEKRYLHPSRPSLQIPRLKKISSLPAPNPYLTFLEWACRTLEWAGPSPESEAVRSAHHVLPVLMHHFGCVCPSHEALAILKEVADGRDILDVGSGNGYWSFMLRQYCCNNSAAATATSKKSNKSPEEQKQKPEQKVIPIDNAQSAWRANWVPDTLISDGVNYLQKNPESSRAAVLLLVYPIVGGGVAGGEEGGFTRNLLRAYKGDTLAVAGTQNHNGYTGFRDRSMDEFMAQDPTLAAEWVKVAQVPLPSFPGKDEALFVYQRGSRAPPKDVGDGNTEQADAAS